MKKILIVEDHAEISLLIRMTLEYEAHEIHEAHDGASGLARAQALRPDLVLLDVMMPGALDGLAVCARIKADPDLVGTKVIILSARGQQRDREAGLAAGADVYLVKPFSPRALIETVDALFKPATPA